MPDCPAGGGVSAAKQSPPPPPFTHALTLNMSFLVRQIAQSCFLLISPDPTWPICAQKWRKTPFIAFVILFL